MSFFGNKVDNSKLTPEFHNAEQGQANQNAADNANQIMPPVDENNQMQSTPQQNNDGQVDEQIVNNQQGTNEGIQVGEEVFNSQEDLLNAYAAMKENLENRETSYKNLQKEYTKARQEIAMRNKMATPMDNRQPVSSQPMPNMFNPYNNGPVGPQYAGQRPMMPNPYNFNYNPYMANIYGQQQTPSQNNASVNKAMIDMAAETKIMELKNADPDFDEVAGELWNIMDTDAYFSNIKFTDPDMATNAIGAAYQMAKQKVEAAKANIKINNAKAEAYRSKQQKLINNDNSNVANKGKTQPQKTDAQKVKESIIGAKPLTF